MKLVLFATVIFILVALPLLALEAMIMPTLQSMKQSYMQADATANRIAEAK
jgi:hypothetical protein